MRIKRLMQITESAHGKNIYTKMLKWLDSPNRKAFDDPRKLVRCSGVQAGQTVLEIGCGSGFFTAAVSEMLGDEGKLYATDIHPIAIEETQKKVNRLKLNNVIVKQDDAMKSLFSDDMFDVVLLYGVVPAPVISMEDISREIYRLLKPEGVLAIWTKAPFWSPKVAVQKCNFRSIEKSQGVFRLAKM